MKVNKNLLIDAWANDHSISTKATFHASGQPNKRSTECSQLLRPYIGPRCLRRSPRPGPVWFWEITAQRSTSRCCRHLTCRWGSKSRQGHLSFSHSVFSFRRVSVSFTDTKMILTSSMLENNHFPFRDVTLINPWGNSPSSAVFLSTKTKPLSWYIKVIGISCSAARSLFSW